MLINLFKDQLVRSSSKWCFHWFNVNFIISGCFYCGWICDDICNNKIWCTKCWPVKASYLWYSRVVYSSGLYYFRYHDKFEKWEWIKSKSRWLLTTVTSFYDLNNSFYSLFEGNILQPETIVLNVSGRVLMVNREINGNASEQLVRVCSFNNLRSYKHAVVEVWTFEEEHQWICVLNFLLEIYECCWSNYLSANHFSLSHKSFRTLEHSTRQLNMNFIRHLTIATLLMSHWSKFHS